MSAQEGSRELNERGSDLPLTGIKVLELGHIVAGPSAGLILADMGADVVKVEPPGRGDQGRRSMREAFPFFNRNKRSIVVDLKSELGRSIFRQMAAQVDVVLDNYAPGVAERLGVAYPELAKINERLVYLSIKGFLEGPYAHRPSLDEMAQMMGGLAYMTGPVGRPLRAGASVIDIGAATYGVIGVLGALMQRARTGRGQLISAGLFETSAFFVGQWMALAAAQETPSVPMPERGQGARTGWAIYELFDCSDGQQLFIGITSDEQWERFCRAFNIEELVGDERLGSNTLRIAERSWLLPYVREHLRPYGLPELTVKLEEAGIPFAPVKRPDQLLDDPQLRESGQLLTTRLVNSREGMLPKLPYRSSEYEFTLRREAPDLGEHTQLVFEEMGLLAESNASGADVRLLEARE